MEKNNLPSVEARSELTEDLQKCRKKSKLAKARRTYAKQDVSIILVGNFNVITGERKPVKEGAVVLIMRRNENGNQDRVKNYSWDLGVSTNKSQFMLPCYGHM